MNNEQCPLNSVGKNSYCFDANWNISYLPMYLSWLGIEKIKNEFQKENAEAVVER